MIAPRLSLQAASFSYGPRPIFQGLDLELGPGEIVSPEAIRYVNRVSDFLFVAARAVNDNGEGDVLWVPGENR